MNTLVLCSSVGEACYCKSLWFVHHRRQPCWEGIFSLNKGTWLSNISVTCTGWSVEEVAHCGDEICFSMLSKMKTREAGEGIPSGRNWGAWIGLQVIFKTYPPSKSVQTSAAFPRFSGKTSVVQLFLLTRQHASLNQGQTSGLGEGAFPQLLDGWGSSEYVSYSIYSSKKNKYWTRSSTFEQEIQSTQNENHRKHFIIRR